MRLVAMLEAVVVILGAGLLAVIGWATNLQARVSVLEAISDRSLTDLRSLISSQFAEVNRRLEAIEGKMYHV